MNKLLLHVIYLDNRMKRYRYTLNLNKICHLCSTIASYSKYTQLIESKITLNLVICFTAKREKEKKNKTLLTNKRGRTKIGQNIKIVNKYKID